MKNAEGSERLSVQIAELFHGALVIKVTALIAVLILLVAIASNLLLQNLSYKALKENVRSNLIHIASQTASTVDAEKLKQIRSEEDENSDVYLELQKNLQRAQDASLGRIRYVYTLTKQGDGIVYVLDAVPVEDTENHSDVGEEFVVEDYTEVLQGFVEPTAEWEPTDDVVYGGMSQTGYAPIRDSSGTVVGVLAVDIDASVIAQKKEAMNNASLISWSVSAALAIVCGILFAGYLTAPILRLKKGMQRVSEGNLDEILVIPRKDELGELADSFNAMVNDLKNYNKELQRISVEMIHQEKMAGIGQLSAGIAHEINNPLGYIKSNVATMEGYLGKLDSFYQLSRDITEKEATEAAETQTEQIQALADFAKTQKLEMLHEDLRDIVLETKAGLKKIEGIVKSLLGFARKVETTDFMSYDLNRGIEDTLVIANNEIKYHAEVVTDFADIPVISAIDGEINQVLLNLIINAAYAIKETGRFGKIVIRTYQRECEVFCDITDNGIGMPEETSKRIFEPFYTTKPVGVGTGLGLSMAYDTIVKKHFGTLTVQSKVGEGTTFTIGLPVNCEEKAKE